MNTSPVLAFSKSRACKFGASTFMLATLAYAIRTRTLEDFLRYPSAIAAAVAVVVTAALLLGWHSTGWRRPNKETLLAILVGGPLMLATAGVLYYSAAVAVKDLYLWLLDPSSRQPLTVVAAGALTLAIGGLLFFFRLKLRCVYGLSEALVGVVVAVHRVATTAISAATFDAGFYLAILTAGIYLVVRGLDNVHQGLTKEPIDPIARRAKEWLESTRNKDTGRAGSKSAA